MKKLVLCIALVVSAMATAQKGTILVGGNVEYNSFDKADQAREENFSFSPAVGYQFSDRMTIGVNGSFSSVNNKYKEQSIGAFLRYGKGIGEGDVFAIYADLGAGYQQRDRNDAKGVYAFLRPALFVNMKKGFGLNFSIGGFNYGNMDGKNDAREETIGFNFGKTINVGISKNFNI